MFVRLSIHYLIFSNIFVYSSVAKKLHKRMTRPVLYERWLVTLIFSACVRLTGQILQMIDRTIALSYVATSVFFYSLHGLFYCLFSFELIIAVYLLYLIRCPKQSSFVLFIIIPNSLTLPI